MPRPAHTGRVLHFWAGLGGRERRGAAAGHDGDVSRWGSEYALQGVDLLHGQRRGCCDECRDVPVGRGHATPASRAASWSSSAASCSAARSAALAFLALTLARLARASRSRR